MKKILLTTTLIYIFSVSTLAQFGKCTPSERFTYIDDKTKTIITVLTDTTQNDKYLYQTDPMWTANDEYLLFRSNKRGNDKALMRLNKEGKKVSYYPTQYFFVEMKSGNIIQVTEGNNILNVYLVSKSNTLYISKEEKRGWSLYAINLNRFFSDVKNNQVQHAKNYEQYIGTVPQEMGKAKGYAIDCSENNAYIGIERKGTAEEYEQMLRNASITETNQPLKIKPTLSGLLKMNLSSGKVSKIIDTEFKIGHIQTSKFTPSEIVFCNETGGDANQRMWFCNVDESKFYPLYKETSLNWVTHETFASKDYVYFNLLGFLPHLRQQANGIARINIRTNDVDLIGQVEMDKDRAAIDGQLSGRGFWHCNASNDDKWVAGDTFAGNIWLINVNTGKRYWIASDAKMKPDHAHPSFSPNGNKLLFQSGHFTKGEKLNLMMVDIADFEY